MLKEESSLRIYETLQFYESAASFSYLTSSSLKLREDILENLEIFSDLANEKRYSFPSKLGLPFNSKLYLFTGEGVKIEPLWLSLKFKDYLVLFNTLFNPRAINTEAVNLVHFPMAFSRSLLSTSKEWSITFRRVTTPSLVNHGWV